MRTTDSSTTEPAIARTGQRHRRLGWLALGTAATVAFLAYFHRPLLKSNFGVVDEGRVYRAAQPFTTFRDLVRQHHLRSVLNLRGGSSADPFYANEVRVSSEEKLALYDFPMSAERRPTRRELLILLDLFDRCEYPLLIHCKSGADRTGLATVLYRMSRRGEPYALARDGFSLRYGHVASFGTQRLHEPFEEYERWLNAHHLPHSPERLRAWIERDYRSNEPPGLVTPLRPGPRVPSSHKNQGTRVAREEPRAGDGRSKEERTSR